MIKEEDKVTVLAAYGKGLILLINRKQFKQLFEKLEKKPFLPNTKRGGDVEQALNKKCLFIANTQVIFCDFNLKLIKVVT